MLDIAVFLTAYLGVLYNIVDPTKVNADNAPAVNYLRYVIPVMLQQKCEEFIFHHEFMNLLQRSRLRMNLYQCLICIE